MGMWAVVVVAVAVVAGVFFAVTGFRGLMEVLENYSGGCLRCGRTTMWPLPSSHACRRCHYGDASLWQLLTRAVQLRH